MSVYKVAVLGGGIKSVLIDSTVPARVSALEARISSILVAAQAVNQHKNLSGLQVGDDHPQYTMWAANETITGAWNFQTEPFIEGETLTEFIEDVIGGEFIQDSVTVYWDYGDTAGTLEANVDQTYAYNWQVNHTWIDDAEVRLGTGGDLRISHNGTSSIIRNDTGVLRLQAGAVVALEISALGVLSSAQTATWSGQHTFTANPIISQSEPYFYIKETDQAADEQLWRVGVQGKTLKFSLVNDAISTEVIGFSISRGTGTVVGGITFGNTTDKPVITFTGRMVPASTISALVTNSGTSAIYATDGTGSGDFASAGHLIIQPRTSAARDIILMAGTTSPSEQARIYGVGAVGLLTQTRLSGTISPSQLTSNTDNWAPTGLATCTAIRFSTDASRNITGITAQPAGTILLLMNVGSQDAVLVHDATSTAANRFYCPNGSNVTLKANSWAMIWYDSTSSRWRVIGTGSTSGGGTAADVQIFTSSGTWNKPSGSPQMTEVICIGAGGGGGSGRKGATGSTRASASGGGGGAYSSAIFPTSALSSSETVTVSSSGGAGGAANAADSTDGNNGTAGGDTSFGAHLRATGGRGGTGSGVSSSASVAGGSGLISDGGASGGGGSDTDGAAVKYGGGGGGSGGGVTSGNLNNSGGDGGTGPTVRTTPLVGGTGGAGSAVASGTDGGSGNGATTDWQCGSGGGGGGSCSSTNASHFGGQGGDAGGYGGGGGAGGSSTNGSGGSKRGGNGGPGLCVAITYY